MKRGCSLDVLSAPGTSKLHNRQSPHCRSHDTIDVVMLIFSVVTEAQDNNLACLISQVSVQLGVRSSLNQALPQEWCQSDHRTSRGLEVLNLRLIRRSELLFIHLATYRVIKNTIVFSTGGNRLSLE
eukprot:g67176.t1